MWNSEPRRQAKVLALPSVGLVGNAGGLKRAGSKGGNSRRVRSETYLGRSSTLTKVRQKSCVDGPNSCLPTASVEGQIKGRRA
jgi:hypothetical protein